MNKKNVARGIEVKNGFVADYSKLREQAQTVQELVYIEKVEKDAPVFAFAFQSVCLMSCGHYEIFQTVDEHAPYIEPENQKCTSCVMEI